MSDKTDLFFHLDVTPEQRERIQSLARQQGFNDLGEYVRTLINQDAEKQGEEALFQAYTRADLLKDFRQAWHDAMTGNVLPLSALDELDDE